MYAEAEQIKQLIDEAKKIVIIQADNPDADSLGSALALEHLLGDLGKEPYLYAGIDMPTYLRYLSGWDRVQNELPAQFDASIIVDASTMTLLEKLVEAGYQKRLASKPSIVLDHHETVENPVPFATVTLNDPGRASTGELIYLLAKQVGWKLSSQSQEYIMTTILGDTQGLTNQLATAETYRLMAEMVDAGIDRPKLEELRRQYSKMVPEIFRYKAELIKRTELTANGQIASVTIPQTEISRYSPLYNPAPLIQNDMLQTSGVRVAIVFKHYADGKVTAAIRCSADAPVGGKLAEHMGGGGHAFASGFKDTSGRPFNDIKTKCLAFTEDLLAKIEPDEAL
jgi:phosphoesterase RecJ-like protein